MIYLLKIMIFHGYASHNQRLLLSCENMQLEVMISPKTCRSRWWLGDQLPREDASEISARDGHGMLKIGFFLCQESEKVIGFKWLFFKEKKTQTIFSVGSHPSLGTQDSAGPSEISVATSLVFLVFSWLVSYPNFFGVKYQCPPGAGESLVPITTSSCFIDSLQLSFLCCWKSLFCIFQTPVAYWCLAGNEGMIHNHQ